ncbi:isovaleryl-CoA dehydrogenase [Alteromonas sp. BMJM2]|uniref:isovaleryl-CoA dehydrogenase n=1 Tax=Alteromonas sp. BMJM2 TaxID=2954241 RepID=UPI0022B2B028|nr:isovaleryl-CoA dehydrogenase [Alteromonas sp. BMJM2]
MKLSNKFHTHEVVNQPHELLAYNLWLADPLLQSLVKQHHYAPLPTLLDKFGQYTGEMQFEHGELANKNKPILHAFDRYGRRTDNVEFHPSYHALMGSAMEHQVHSYSWQNSSIPGAHVVRATLLYIHSQADAGTTCPLTMTHAAVPAIQYAKHLPDYWLDKIINGSYDSRALPALEKNGITVGMGMTEKQGGSDVRRNTTKAVKQADGSYAITGHKFFYSAPMCDAHLVLAQAKGGLSCFLLPRILENGELNHVRIQRLKDKLGDWSNASSEVEFQEATAYLVGEEGRGVSVIIDMVSLTRLDCMIGSSALMRQALIQAIHHVSHRDAFGNTLINQPLMQNVLADLTIESAAATALTMRVAKAVDESRTNPQEAALARICTAIGKYWICKRTATFVNEAQECLGGIGYVEENIMPRLYRQAPLNSIWEGSGNVQCLDVLRAMAKEPATQKTLFSELKSAKGKNSHFDEYVAQLSKGFSDTEALEMRSRLLTEQTALALQACVLLNNEEAEIRTIANSFCESRLAGRHGLAFGTLPASAPCEEIITAGALSKRG